MKKIKFIDLTKFLIFAAILIVSIILLVENRHFLMHLKIDTIIDFAHAKKTRIYAVVIMLLIFIIKPIFVIIPNSVIAIVNGLMFGPFEGFLITLIGYFISSTIGFYLARLLGRDFIENIGGGKLNNIEEKLQKNQFIIILSLRLIPVMPLGPVNYACGLANVAYEKFITATLIGTAPEILCYTFLGKNFDRPKSPAFIIPIIVLGSIIICSKIIMKKANRIK